jgi:hypothetical protein
MGLYRPAMGLLYLYVLRRIVIDKGHTGQAKVVIYN